MIYKYQNTWKSKMKDYFSKFGDNLKTSWQKRKAYVSFKKQVLQDMTINEAKQTYITYIDFKAERKTLDHRNDYKEIKVPLTPKQMKREINMKLTLDQIFHSIPRLKRKYSKEAEEFK